MKRLELSGKIFGRWTVLSFSHMNGYQSYWNCLCVCGARKKVSGSHLSLKKSQSCGCLNREGIHFLFFFSLNIILIDSIMKIPLNNGSMAIIDPEDFPKIKDYTWRIDSTGYASTTIDKKPVRMHRVVAPVKPNLVVDHINRNKLDNRRSNLRVVEHKINIINHNLFHKNTSGCSGVSFNKRLEKFESYITIDCKKIHLGFFSEKMKAFEESEKAIKERKDLYEK